VAKKLIPPKNSSSPTRVIEKLLKEKLIGQERAIREIIRGLERAYSGLKNPDHPVAVLAFFGPTGTGKTFAAEALANCFPRHKVWRCPRHYECGYVITEEERQAGIQVAEYCPTHNGKLRIEKIVSNTIWTIDCGGVSGALDHAITTLMGSPPSYVGQEITPIFTGGKAPHVVLFDEAEKALLTKNWSGGSSFANVLLKILEKGRIRNNLNEEIDFTQSIIILTGNLGAAEILKEFEGVLGFHVSSKDRHRDIAQMTDQEVGDLNKRIYIGREEKGRKGPGAGVPQSIGSAGGLPLPHPKRIRKNSPERNREVAVADCKGDKKEEGPRFRPHLYPGSAGLSASRGNGRPALRGTAAGAGS
jgi:hypothetical protein